MEFRAKERVSALVGGLALSTGLFAQPALQYEVWHGHSRVYSLPPHVRRTGAPGTLKIDDTGVSFEQRAEEGKKKPKRPEAFRWEYRDIQQLKISPKTISVVTYRDNKWKLGADRQYDFDLVSEGDFRQAYELLKTRLDQRFVAAVPDKPEKALWEIPVKHLSGVSGDEGMLRVGAGEIVYQSDKADRSRTWRYRDIDNISSSGPFQLTITTFERAKLSYGSRKAFNFQLKEPLEEARYNDLWLRLNQSKGLKILSSYREGADGR